MRQDDDFLQDDLDDEKTIEFIKNYLPQDLKDKFTDDEFYYFLDLIDEYYTQSGILDAQPDADGCIDIDLEKWRKSSTTSSGKPGKTKWASMTPRKSSSSCRAKWNTPTRWTKTNNPDRDEKNIKARIPTDSRLVYNCFSLSLPRKPNKMTFNI